MIADVSRENCLSVIMNHGPWTKIAGFAETATR